MSNTILVTYASRAGSTAGVAQAIGKTLTECGAQVDVRPMQDVDNLNSYQAVVVGSAIQDARWLPEAMQFLETNQVILTQKPVATFSVCMTLAMKNERYHEAVKKWLEPVRSLVQPLSEGFFAGTLDISKVPSFRKRMMFRLSVALGVWSAGDHRDWNAIHRWASSLATQLDLSDIADRPAVLS